MKSLFITIFLCVSIVLFNGCDDSEDFVTFKNGEPITSESAAGLGLSSFVDALLEGGTIKIGEVGMGLVLSLLGFGEGEDDNQDLENIENELSEIQGELTNLTLDIQKMNQELKIDTDKIILNANDPHDAINNITTRHEKLLRSIDTNITETNQYNTANEIATDIKDFDIEKSVEDIYAAIVPQDVAKDSILNNYLDLNYDSKSFFHDSYYNHEQYTSQLLYYQLQGAALVTQSYNFFSDNNDTTQSTAYINKTFLPKLYSEIYQANVSTSFFANALRAVLLYSDIHKDANEFLPDYTQEILSRADHFRYSVLKNVNCSKNIHGVTTCKKEENITHDMNRVKVYLLSTADEEPLNLYVQTFDNNDFFLPINITNEANITGLSYDSWNEDGVKKDNQYSLYTYDFGSLQEGTYDVYNQDSDTKVTTFKTIKYDENYTKSDTGENIYGLGVIANRITNRYTEDSPRWSTIENTNNSKTIEVTGDANDLPYKVAFKMLMEQQPSFNGKAEMKANFDYTGDVSKTITINYDVNVSGDVAAGGEMQEEDTYARLYIGVWDETSNDYPNDTCKNISSLHEIGNNVRVHHFKKNLIDGCTFTAEPNHSYHLYIKMHVYMYDGGELGQARIQVDKVNYITFDID